MIRRLCRECGSEMIKELTPDGPGFFCKSCEGYTRFDEVDMEPYCPVCSDRLQFCSKCSQGYFCNTCNGLVSRKKIVWKEH
ncbi:MAG: hypothetical protein EG824_05010 [Deltaproteobacteria bacterium]|nr:hypothetical protein [Deltaproteobacteria bacterium]